MGAGVCDYVFKMTNRMEELKRVVAEFQNIQGLRVEIANNKAVTVRCLDRVVLRCVIDPVFSSLMIDQHRTPMLTKRHAGKEVSTDWLRAFLVKLASKRGEFSVHWYSNRPPARRKKKAKPVPEDNSKYLFPYTFKASGVVRQLDSRYWRVIDNELFKLDGRGNPITRPQ